MLSLISDLINKIESVNDGTFEIEDLETERLKNI